MWSYQQKRARPLRCPGDFGRGILTLPFTACAPIAPKINGVPHHCRIERLKDFMPTATDTIEGLVQTEYKYGFYTDVETESAPPGLSEDIIRLISSKRRA